MEQIDRILEHPDFMNFMEFNSQAEKDREFCHHDLAHAVDVARTAYILVLENKYELSKELVYTAALLHDVGRWRQYRDKVDHAEESVILSEPILKDIGTKEEDIKLILGAIGSHRTKDEKSSLLSKVLYEADKACRLCVSCKMLKDCNRFDGLKKPVLKY